MEIVSYRPVALADADDTSTLVATRSWEETDKIMQETASYIEEYSKEKVKPECREDIGPEAVS